MKIDVMEGDEFWQCDNTMWQVRGEKFRWIGNGNDWSYTVGGRYPICGTPRRRTTIEDARKNAESLGHELVMPEEKGPWYTVANYGALLTFVSRESFDRYCNSYSLKPCNSKGEVIP